MKDSDLWIITLILQLVIMLIAAYDGDWSLVASGAFGAFMCAIYREEIKKQEL